jgi:hypothetical protein
MKPKVDMSAKAVTTRLKRVSQLRRLCLSLGAAKINQASVKKNGPSVALSSKPDERSGK